MRAIILRLKEPSKARRDADRRNDPVGRVSTRQSPAGDRGQSRKADRGLHLSRKWRNALRCSALRLLRLLGQRHAPRKQAGHMTATAPHRNSFSPPLAPTGPSTHALRCGIVRLVGIRYVAACIRTAAAGLVTIFAIGGLLVAGFPADAADFTFTTLDVPGASYLGTLTFGINDAGQIVGYFYKNTGIHGFPYSGGRFTTIDVPGAVFATDARYARGINDAGQIVGYFFNDTGLHSFLAISDLSLSLGDPTACGCGQAADPKPNALAGEPINTATGGVFYTECRRFLDAHVPSISTQGLIAAIPIGQVTP